MPYHTPTLSDTQTLKQARTILEEHLPLEARGYCCQREHLYDVLIGVSARQESIEALCQSMPSMPSADTVRHHLNGQLTLERLPELEHSLNQALGAELPRRLRRNARKSGLRIAIDFHDQPYYGKAPQEEALYVRAKAKAGTTRFLRVATAYVIHRGLRLTLALRFVRPQDSTVGVVEHLRSRLEALELPIQCLLLDKGFSGIAVLKYLDEHQVPAIIACPIRGKKDPDPSATRALCQGRKSYSVTYTFSNRETSFTAQLAVCRVFTTARRTGRMKRRGTWHLFIVLGEALQARRPQAIKRLYRGRFGVETSYRLSSQVRAWTSSPNAAYRFVLIGLSFFMVNVWVHLCWLFTQVARRGGRWLDVERFRLRRYAKFIEQALERRYGCRQQIVAPAVPLL
ncbi:MAG TPA: hypothetical protein VLV83_00020 [Acidobacteriota bacterium]|nr:hypothetical protein [Acidobacteriota bacterium]